MIAQSIAYQQVMAAPLLQSYVSRFSSLHSFYPHDPSDPEIWSRMVGQVRSRGNKPPRQELVSILTRQNSNFGADEHTIKNIQALGHPETYVISTGQQVGLCTGPLYTIYKAITTIKLSTRISDQLGLRVVPVFWMASDDHDFAEINHVFVCPLDEEIQKIELRKDDPADRRSAAARQMGAEVNTLIDHLAHLLPEGVHKQSVIDCLDKVCLPEASLSDVFARLMTRLFEGHGLIMVDPTDTELKPLMSEVFTREILHPLASTKAVLETSKQLRKAGYTPQVDRTPDAVNLFLYDQGQRRAVTYKNDQFLSRHNGATFRREDLLKIISDNPATLSHNVVTRPIVQDALFPSLAYIGGPSEVAYYAQFGKVYEYFGLPFPVIYPRASLTLVEPRIDRILKKHGLTIMHFTEDIKQVLNQRLQADMPDGIVDSLQSARKTMGHHYKTLFNQVTDVDPVLQGIVNASERKTAYALNKLEEKTLKAFKRKNKTTRDQIMRADRQLYPLGGLQERSLNIWQYISLYGFEFMDTLFEAVDETDFSHRVISL